MPMRVLVVDDEAAARQRLVRLLADCDVEVAGEAADGLEALELIARVKPDVVLLDIEMPEVSGLDVARRLSDPRPLVVFQTAFGHYAVEAFEREALDFLLKPVTRERLDHALDRATRRLAERTSAVPFTAEMAARIEASLEHRTRAPRPRRLLVRHQAGHRLVPVAEIERCVAEDGLVYAVVRGERHIVDDTLDELEGRLTGVFVRTSRADLLAIDRVDRLVSNGDGSAAVTMRDGSVWRVSRRRAAEVRKALQQ
jgi:two-component system LytT family response regulator